MLFYKHAKVVLKLSILVNGNPINQVENFNYLGINLGINPTLKKYQFKSQGSLAYYVS